MLAFKGKIKDKLDQDLKAAKATGDKRQLMVRRMLDNEKKLQARITELENQSRNDKDTAADSTT